MMFTYTRDAVEANGILSEVIEGDVYITKKYTLKNPPLIKGTYKEEKAWDSDRTYKIVDGLREIEYTANEYAELFSYSLTKEYTQKQSSGGTVELRFDKSGTKLRKAYVYLNGSGEYSWWHNDRYARVMAEVMQVSGKEQKDISFVVNLRSPD